MDFASRDSHGETVCRWFLSLNRYQALHRLHYPLWSVVQRRELRPHRFSPQLLPLFRNRCFNLLVPVGLVFFFWSGQHSARLSVLGLLAHGRSSFGRVYCSR